MLKKMNRYIGHAYTVAHLELKATGEVEEGSWVTIDTDGKLIVSNGTKKSFLLSGSKRTGRDYTSSGIFKGVAFVHGPFYGLNTSCFDNTKEYAPMTALKVTTGGKLTPVTGVGPEIIEAYAIKKISATELMIMSTAGVEAIASHAAPAAPSVTRDDTANTVTGMTTAMEYNLDDAGYVAYVANTFNAIDFAGNHTLLVRLKKAGSFPAGLATTLTFGTNAAPVAPSVTRDDTANTVTGMTTVMEYNLDNAGYVTYDETTFNAIDLSGNHTLLVRTKVAGTNPTGAVTTLTFTTNL